MWCRASLDTPRQQASSLHLLSIALVSNLRNQMSPYLLTIALALSSVDAAITSLKQISYNQYEVAFTGSEPRLEDVDGALLPSSRSGNVLTLNETGHWNNVRSASQMDGQIRITFKGIFSSWYSLYSAAGSDGNQRQQVAGSTVVNSPYALYTPRMSINDDPGSGEAWDFDVGSGSASSVLTIRANRVAPVLTYALMDGTVVAAHKTSTYTCAVVAADPRFCAYTVTVPLPPSFVAGTTTLTACALISETEYSCTTHPYAAPSPPAPPAAPPSPPRSPEPPSPPPTPKPPDTIPAGGATIATTDLVAWVVIGSIAGAAIVAGAAYQTVKYVKEAMQTTHAA